MKQVHYTCPECSAYQAAAREQAGCMAVCAACYADIRVPLRSTCLPPRTTRLMKRAGLTAGIAVAALLLTWAGHWTGSRRGAGGTAAAVEPPPGPLAGHATKDQPARDPRIAVITPETAALRVEEAEIVNRELISENSRIKGEYDGLLQWVFDNVRGRFPVPERLVDDLRLSPVNDDYALSDDVAEVLHVTEDERVYMDDVFQYTRDAMTGLETEMISILESGDARITLHIPPYADSGDMMREDLYAALETTLGPARFDRFMDVSEEELEKKYHYFGQADRTLTFEVIETGQSDIPAYLLIRDGWVVAESEDVRQSTVTETAVIELPSTYRPYAGWLPEHFPVYVAP